MIFPYPDMLEVRQYSATQQHRTQKVDLDRTHPFVPVNTFGGTAGACHTRIVDQDVEASEFRKRSLHQGARISGLGDIGSQRCHYLAGPGEVSECRGGLVELRLTARAEQHAGAGLEEHFLAIA